MPNQKVPLKSNLRPKFEDCISIIDAEINKRRSKWTLTAISWMDFDDVSQILRIHIFKKWELYDPSYPLEPWLNRIITNQMSNLRRNIYDNNSRPCLKCAAAEGEDLCEIYSKQSSCCPLYAHWGKTKKYAHDIKLPLSIDGHIQQVYDIPSCNSDISDAIEGAHDKMLKILNPMQRKIYKFIYIDQMSDIDAGKKMN